jgi:hypothetical protein
MEVKIKEHNRKNENNDDESKSKIESNIWCEKCLREIYESNWEYHIESKAHKECKLKPEKYRYCKRCRKSVTKKVG